MKAYKAAKEYGFVNSRVRGQLARSLRIADYERLLQSRDYKKFIGALRGTRYGAVISAATPTELPSPEELALILAVDYADVSHRLTRSLSGTVRRFAEAYALVFLIEGLKTVIRGKHVGLEKSEILSFVVPTSPGRARMFAQLLDKENVEKLIEDIPILDLKIALLTKLPAYEEFESAVPLEVALEEWYLRKVLESLEEFSDENKQRIVHLLEARVNLRNTTMMLRAQILGFNRRMIDASIVRFTEDSQAFGDSIRQRDSWGGVLMQLKKTKHPEMATRLRRIYTETQDLAEIELDVEDYLAQQIKKQLTGFPFHLGTVIGFFNLKYLEMRNLISIAVGIEKGEPASIIRQMITIW
ncbi:MAG: V-type ATPase subunit [Candidatus Thorarchaeota archaeon]